MGRRAFCREVHVGLDFDDSLVRVSCGVGLMLTPQDMFEIQSALERYEKAFPRKPSPTPATALAWAAGKRGLPGECGPLSWLWESFLVWRQVSTVPRIGRFD
jgi:hypothetical protein